MTQFLIAESLKHGTHISEHKVPVSSQIFDHNFLITYPSNITCFCCCTENQGANHIMVCTLVFSTIFSTT